MRQCPEEAQKAVVSVRFKCCARLYLKLLHHKSIGEAGKPGYVSPRKFEESERLTANLGLIQRFWFSQNTTHFCLESVHSEIWSPQRHQGLSKLFKQTSRGAAVSRTSREASFCCFWGPVNLVSESHKPSRNGDRAFRRSEFKLRHF